MTRSPLFLAALASSAVPGLDPVSVEGVAVRPADLFEVAYVQDGQDRRWVVKVPLTAAAGAMLDDVTALSGLLGRRLDVATPMVRGHAPVPEGRAAVYLRVPGRPLDFAGLDAGPLAEELGRTLAHIHNVEHLLFEEAGRPTYDAEAHRHRRLSDLDRAASTGHVPTGLLTRWEHRLEDVSLWRFAPTAVHGQFSGENVLASFDDEQDAGSGHIRGVLAWEQSRVGDPADDFAALAAEAAPETLDTVLEAYAQSRVERPDANLVARARLAAEMAPLATLLHALASGQLDLVEATARDLRALEERTEAEDARNAEQDAARSARTRERVERARIATGAVPVGPVALDPDDPERPEPDWDATQPHTPFPMLGETQLIWSSASSDVPSVGAATSSPGPTEVSGAEEHHVPGVVGDLTHDPQDPSPVRDEAGDDGSGRAPVDVLESEPQPVPVVASNGDGSPFEIDEVEALPDGVLDLHEGASDFVPVTGRRARHGDAAS